MRISSSFTSAEGLPTLTLTLTLLIALSFPHPPLWPFRETSSVRSFALAYPKLPLSLFLSFVSACTRANLSPSFRLASISSANLSTSGWWSARLRRAKANVRGLWGIPRRVTFSFSC